MVQNKLIHDSLKNNAYNEMSITSTERHINHFLNKKNISRVIKQQITYCSVCCKTFNVLCVCKKRLHFFMKLQN